jgi:plasmid maintenance system killer protein
VLGRANGHVVGKGGGKTARLDPRIQRVALRKLAMLDAAELLDDLRIPPGNRLEAPHGDDRPDSPGRGAPGGVP